MDVFRRVHERPDVTAWEPAAPMAYQPGLDVELESNGDWTIYDGAKVVKSGRGKWRLRIAWWRANRARRVP